MSFEKTSTAGLACFILWCLKDYTSAQQAFERHSQCMHSYPFVIHAPMSNKGIYLYQDVVMIGSVSMHMHVPMFELNMTVMFSSVCHQNFAVQGVEISHRAEVATVAGVQTFLENSGYELNYSDSEISYLPLAHIFDR